MNKTKIKFIAIIILLIIIIGLGKYFNWQTYINQGLEIALNEIKHLGYLGVIAFILIYILATILFIPGSFLTLGSGAIFGVIWGTVYVSIGSILGGTLAFLVGRYMARDWIDHQLEGKANFKKIAEAVSKDGWKIVLLTRLSPVFPFNLLNYAFGITKVSLKDYFLASWIGMLPGTIMYVYIGSVIGDIAKLSLGVKDRQRTTGELILYGVGFLATIGVTIYITKIAKKALENESENSV